MSRPEIGRMQIGVAVVEELTGVLVQVSEAGVGKAYIVMDGLEVDELVANLQEARRLLRVSST